MDSMEVNKGIAAVLVAGIIFFLTGLIADNLVAPTELAKSVLDIKGVPTSGAPAAAKPAPLPPIAPLLAKADVGAGDKFVHTVCTACHSFNEGGKPIVGPNLYNIVGAPHDHEAGFSYSPALEKFKGQPWTYDALNHWLHDPQEYAPGTRMSYTGIRNNQQRADVIAYLRTLSPHPEPLPAVQPAAKAAPAATSPTGGGAGGGTAVAPQTPGAGKAPAGAANPATPPASAASGAAKPAAPAPATPAPAAPAKQ